MNKDNYEILTKKYLAFFKSKGVTPKEKHLINLYHLNNSAGMIILGKLIMFESELKSELKIVLEAKFSSNFNDFKIDLNNKVVSNAGNHIGSVLGGIETMINKKNPLSFEEFCEQLMFDQMLFIITSFNQQGHFEAFTKMSSSYFKTTQQLKAYRNLLAHGGQLTKQYFTSPAKKAKPHKLVAVLKYLFKRYPTLKNELTELMLHYDEKKIGVEKTDVLKELGIIGIIGEINNVINDREGFYEFYISYHYKEIKNGKISIKKTFPKLFGSTKYKKHYKETTNASVEIDRNYIRWYKKFLGFKNELGSITSFEILILRILWTSQNQKIGLDQLKNIASSSISNMKTIERICKTFKITINKGEKVYDPKELQKNTYLIKGYKSYKKSYLVNKKGDIVKITNSKPFIKTVKRTARSNGKGNKHYKVSINGKGEALHRIVAELFIANPKGYEFVHSTTGDYINFTPSSLKWKKQSAKPWAGKNKDS